MDIESLAARVAELEAEREILATVNRYVHGIDYGPPEDWADCFTEDGVYEVTMLDGTNRKIVGHDDLLAFASEHPVPPQKYYKHFVFAPSIALDGDSAVVRSIMGRIDQTDAGPVIDVFGRYLDQVVRCDDGRWRFSHRHSFVEAVAPSFAEAGLTDDEG